MGEVIISKENLISFSKFSFIIILISSYLIMNSSFDWGLLFSTKICSFY